MIAVSPLTKNTNASDFTTVDHLYFLPMFPYPLGTSHITNVTESYSENRWNCWPYLHVQVLICNLYAIWIYWRLFKHQNRFLFQLSRWLKVSASRICRSTTFLQIFIDILTFSRKRYPPSCYLHREIIFSQFPLLAEISTPRH